MAVSRDEIVEKVIEALAKMLHKDKETIQLASSLVEDLELDSFTAVELIFELEDRYGIEIEDEEVETFRTVLDIVEYIEGKIEEE